MPFGMLIYAQNYTNEKVKSINWVMLQVEYTHTRLDLICNVVNCNILRKSMICFYKLLDFDGIPDKLL